MNALLVVDFTTESGLGHLRRALAIAAALKALGWEISLKNTAKKKIPVSDLVTESGVERRSFDACVVDSYNAADALRMSLAPYLAVDDLYLPIPGAIAVLNSAPGADRDRYSVETKLIGPSYALIGEDVVRAKKAMRPPSFPPRSVYLWLGAAATRRLMVEAREAVRSALPEAKLIMPTVNSADPGGAAQMLLDADLVVSGGGVTALEAAALGRPVVGMMLAENQRENISGLAQEGALLEVTTSTMADAISALANDRMRFMQMARRGQQLIDGKGPKRVAEAIEKIFTLDHDDYE